MINRADRYRVVNARTGFVLETAPDAHTALVYSKRWERLYGDTCIVRGPVAS